MAATISPGTLFAERFDVVLELGSGAFGRVFSVRDATTSLPLALKALDRLGPEAHLQFKDEFRRLAHVTHENLVTLHQLNAYDETLFFTMELFDDETLARWSRSREQWELRAAAFQVAVGLDALHRAGLLHGDVKPSNVLCSRDGRIALADFGFASALERGTGVRQPGTVAYSAPELWAGEPVTTASDWYSFGVMLFELLVGQLPFGGMASDTIAARVLGDGPTPSGRAGTIADDLAALVGRLLRRSPERRPTGGEVLEALGGAHALHVPKRETFDRAATSRFLTEAREAARGGAPTVAVVSGSAGMGKTTILSQLRRAELDTNVAILAMRCQPYDRLRGAVVDGLADALAAVLRLESAHMRAALLDGVPASLARMFPTLAQYVASPGPIRNDAAEEADAIAALAQIFGRLAERRGLVLLVDDLHLADDVSGHALGALIRQLGPTARLLVVATRRETSDDVATAAIQRTVGELVVEHSLEPLESDVVRSALRNGVGQLADATVEDLVRSIAGIPLTLEDVINLARSGHRVSDLTDAHAVTRARMNDLKDAARRVAEVVALASVPVSPPCVATAANITLDDYLPVLGVLRSRRLVSTRVIDGRAIVEPAHEGVRADVAATVGPNALRLHAAIADALLAHEPTQVLAITGHLMQAGEAKRAHVIAVAGARDARRALAFSRAAALARQARGSGVASVDEDRELARELADSLALAGRGREASAVFAELMTLDPPRAASYERRAAEQLLYGGFIEDGIAALGRVLGRVELSLPNSRALGIARVVWARQFGAGARVRRMSPELGNVDPSIFDRVDACHVATLGLTMTDPLQSAVVQVDHLTHAVRCGDPVRAARAIATHLVHTAGGWYAPDETARIIQLLRAIATPCNSPELDAEVALALAATAWMEGRWREWLEMTEHAGSLLGRAAHAGLEWHRDTHRLMELEALEGAGRWDELARRLPASLRDAEMRGDRYLEASLRARVAPLARLGRGDVRGAQREIARAEELWARTEFDLLALYAALQRSTVARYDGDAPSAALIMRATSRAMDKSLLGRIAFYRDVVDASYAASLIALAHAKGSEAPTLLTEARALTARLAKHPSPFAQAHSSMLESALLASDAPASASAAYETAALRFEAMGSSHLATGCRRRASILRGQRVVAHVAGVIEAERLLDAIVP